MKSAAVAEPSAHAVEHEDVAARCAVTTLITASTATDVEHLARRIHARGRLDHRQQGLSQTAGKRFGIFRRFDLRDDDQIDSASRAQDRDIRFMPGANAVEPDRKRPPAPIAVRGSDGGSARIVLLAFGDGVFQIEDHHVARKPARFLQRARIGCGKE